MIFTIFKIEFFQLLRHPVSIFWSFLFPTILLVVLSFLFGQNDEKSGKYNLLITPDRYVEFIAKNVDTTKYNIINNAKKLKIDAYLHLVKNKLVLDIYSDNDLQIKNDLYNSLYRALLGERKDQRIEVRKHKKADANDGMLLSFILPGIIGVSLVSVSLFSIGTTLVGFREQSILKKFGTTPLKKWEYLLGHLLGRLLLILMQASWLIILGWILAGVNPMLNIVSIVLSLIVGIMAFSGIGLIIGSTSDKVETASAISNFVFFPMVFLSGAYFPIDTVSPTMLFFIKIIPLYHFVKMFRAVYIENISILNFPVEVGILFAWVVVSIFISKLYFKWDEEV